MGRKRRGAGVRAGLLVAEVLLGAVALGAVVNLFAGALPQDWRWANDWRVLGPVLIGVVVTLVLLMWVRIRVRSGQDQMRPIVAVRQFVVRSSTILFMIVRAIKPKKHPLLLSAIRRQSKYWRTVSPQLAGSPELLRASFRRQSRSAAVSIYTKDRVTSLTVFPLLLMMTPFELYLISGTLYIYESGHIPWAGLAFFGSILVCSLPVIVYGTSQVLHYILFGREVRHPSTVFLRATPAWIVLSVIAVGISSYGLDSSISTETLIGDRKLLLTKPVDGQLAAGLAYTVLLFMLAILLLVIASWLSQFLQKQLRKPYAEADYIVSLLRVAWLLSAEEEQLNSAKHRQQVVKELHQASSLMARGVARALAVPDPIGLAVIKERVASASIWLRDRQLWVMLPNETTYEQLRDDISRLISASLLGQYDRLPQATANAMSKPRRIRVLMAGLKNLLFAVLPVTLFVLIQKMGWVALEKGAIPNSLGLFCIIWLIVRLIIALDPFYSVTLQSARDMFSAIKGAPGGNSKDGAPPK